jgi:hypothetical protein
MKMIEGLKGVVKENRVCSSYPVDTGDSNGLLIICGW